MRGTTASLAVLALCIAGAANAEDVAAPEPEFVEARIHAIDSLEASCDGGVLTLTAQVTTSSLGWTRVRLKAGEATASTINFEAIGTPPDGPAAQALESRRIASQVSAAAGVSQVHVEAATNALDAAVIPAC